MCHVLQQTPQPLSPYSKDGDLSSFSQEWTSQCVALDLRLYCSKKLIIDKEGLFSSVSQIVTINYMHNSAHH